MGRFRFLVGVLALSLAFSATFSLATATPANAFIHEMIGASCSVNGAPEPPGQSGTAGNSTSFIRALQATGVISSIVATPTLVTINFDLSQQPAKFVSAGFSLLITDGAGPGVDLLLNPLPTLQGSTFSAFIHCANLQ